MTEHEKKLHEIAVNSIIASRHAGMLRHAAAYREYDAKAANDALVGLLARGIQQAVSSDPNALSWVPVAEAAALIVATYFKG